jgi:cyclopropane-fatty-acyl-phospholipid synthase
MTLAKVFEELVGPEAPVEFAAYDGSRAGVRGADIRFEVTSPYAVSHLVRSPGSLGLARAYVSGYLDVSGDMHTVLSTMQQIMGDVDAAAKVKILREVLKDPLLRAAVSRKLDPPPQEAPFSRVPSWLRHSKSRDAKAISHHYDVSNAFYEWVLGPSMAYTCACYPTEDATLEEAQYFKHDLVAKKLGLKSGMRLLDVGCGWGGMVMHAAREYGVKALGVTLSKQQAEWAQKAIADRGLSDLAEVRHLDYRDVAETGFDAVSSIGLTEHIGKKNLPSYFSFLHGKLKPYGRMLNHTITRPDNLAPAMKPGGFINRYVFPDGELEGPGYIQTQMNDAGFEIRHQENLREHYARTLAGWCRNLDAHWDEAVAEVGQGTARVWRVYMAGCQVGFEQNWIQLHQTLGVKLDGSGNSSMPLRPTWAS